MQETLFSYRNGGILTFSNSLAFLLAENGLELDADYHDYEADFCSIILGEERASKHTKVKGGKVRMHRNVNVAVADDLTIREESKNRHPKWGNYREYHDWLLGVLRTIADNATDGARRRQYGMISTISRGYDATASSVMAYEVGCREALTMAQLEDDNGSEIARLLGYISIHEVDKNAYKKNTKLLEAEIAGSGEVSGMLEAYEQLCAGKLVFMGDRGDSLWERLHDNVNDHLDFSSGNGFAQASLTPVEYTSRINAIVVRVPLIGGDSWSELARLSSSEEMKPWSVREKYDRPLARRMVEEKGIDRTAFGQEKKGGGVSFHYNTLRSMKAKMSGESYQSLTDFKRHLKRNRWKALGNEVRFYASEYDVYVNYVLSRIGIKKRIKRKHQTYRSSPLGNLMILWGVHEMKKRYTQ